MSQEIIKVSEKQRGEWTETKWSDGRVTMHRPMTKPASDCREETQVRVQ
jgi:hypothetical protein